MKNGAGGISDRTWKKIVFRVWATVMRLEYAQLLDRHSKSVVITRKDICRIAWRMTLYISRMFLKYWRWLEENEMHRSSNTKSPYRSGHTVLYLVRFGAASTTVFDIHHAHIATAAHPFVLDKLEPSLVGWSSLLQGYLSAMDCNACSRLQWPTNLVTKEKLQQKSHWQIVSCCKIY